MTRRAGGEEGEGGRCRNVWHRTPAELAAKLARADGVRRLHAFDIVPQVMRGLYSACFAAADGAVHRYLTSYYLPGELREKLQVLERTVRRLGVVTVDGRIEVGAGTGERLHYFLPDLARARTGDERRQLRRDGYRAWRAAASGAADRGVRVLEETEGGCVVCVSSAHDHYLFRFGNEPDAYPPWEAVRLELDEKKRLVPTDPLWQDVMGRWLP